MTRPHSLRRSTRWPAALAEAPGVTVVRRRVVRMLWRRRRCGRARRTRAYGVRCQRPLILRRARRYAPRGLGILPRFLAAGHDQPHSLLKICIYASRQGTPRDADRYRTHGQYMTAAVVYDSLVPAIRSRTSFLNPHCSVMVDLPSGWPTPVLTQTAAVTRKERNEGSHTHDDTKITLCPGVARWREHLVKGSGVRKTPPGG